MLTPCPLFLQFILIIIITLIITLVFSNNEFTSDLCLKPIQIAHSYSLLNITLLKLVRKLYNIQSDSIISYKYCYEIDQEQYIKNEQICISTSSNYNNVNTIVLPYYLSEGYHGIWVSIYNTNIIISRTRVEVFVYSNRNNDKTAIVLDNHINITKPCYGAIIPDYTFDMKYIYSNQYNNTYDIQFEVISLLKTSLQPATTSAYVSTAYVTDLEPNTWFFELTSRINSVDVSRSSEEGEKEVVVTDGMTEYGYIEFVLSPTDIVSRRHFPPQINEDEGESTATENGEI